MLNVRSYSSWRLSQLSLLVPNLSVLKYFDFTLPRHKSSKIEGSGPLIMSHSIQFHCVVLTSPLYLKGKPFTQDVIWKGYMFRVIYSLLPLYALIFEENSQKSPKIDLNRMIRQQIFRFLKYDFFGSIGPSAKNQSHWFNAATFGVCWLFLEPSIGAVGLSAFRVIRDDGTATYEKFSTEKVSESPDRLPNLKRITAK